MSLRLLLAASLALCASLAKAEDAALDVRASSLLKRAADYYQLQGDAALPAFSRQGEFIDGDRFVFVVDSRGTLLASGGPTAVLIGREVSRVLAPELQAAFTHAFSASDDVGIQTVEYRWNNSAQHRVELKRVYFNG
ncbi:hypothetical protein SAMN03159488_03415 [Pseudomonas sp. NFIX10]|nr:MULTISPECIES: hypothetical protein [unclassified Pseudomonas]SFB38315.1 hypothetical protein SAMN03159488_03415 [Pseudomonas sp. NFIX10]SFF47162.1 hypothetical protein SAMN03159367_04737 [Pseudomonas sp. NFACC06-1]